MQNHRTNMSISLPNDLKAYVRQRTREAHYGTPSDYMRSLIREDVRRAEQELLEQALLKGLHSGRGVSYGTKEWNAFKKRVIQSIARKKKQRL